MMINVGEEAFHLVMHICFISNISMADNVVRTRILRASRFRAADEATIERPLEASSISSSDAFASDAH